MELTQKHSSGLKTKLQVPEIVMVTFIWPFHCYIFTLAGSNQNGLIENYLSNYPRLNVYLQAVVVCKSK